MVFKPRSINLENTYRSSSICASCRLLSSETYLCRFSNLTKKLTLLQSSIRAFGAGDNSLVIIYISWTGL